MKFSEFSFHPDLQRGIDAMGFEDCMPVQEETFKHLQKGLDVYAQSQTGTGKTAAFLVGGLQYLLDHGGPDDKFLVVAPTRELAVQIEQEARGLAQFLPYRPATFLGGVGYHEQKRQLSQGATILIGTPGRILDLYASRDMPLGQSKVVVVDEADRMFDMGFIDDLRKIIKAVPPKEKRLMMLFSATLNGRVGNLAWEYMRETGEVVIEPEKVTVEGVSQQLYHLSRDEKVPLLLGLLQREQPNSALIFVNTKDEAYQLTRRLEHNGLEVKMLMGNLPQRDRLRVFNQLRRGEVKLVVATDVAARGLHVDDLDMVINYDLPDEAENYVHRIGRTARAGKTGKVVSFACETFVRNLAPIERFIGYKIPVEWVDDSLVTADKSEGLKFARPGRSIAGKEGARRGAGQRMQPFRGGRSRTDQRAPLAAKGSARRPRAEAGNRGAQAEARSGTKPGKGSPQNRRSLATSRLNQAGQRREQTVPSTKGKGGGRQPEPGRSKVQRAPTARNNAQTQRRQRPPRPSAETAAPASVAKGGRGISGAEMLAQLKERKKRGVITKVLNFFRK